MSTEAHLRVLEAESIYITREVAAGFERPVMLYSIGKDSSVMVRLAQRAFHSAPIPCTVAIRSEANSLPKIIEEMSSFRRSERKNPVIDHDQEGSMELKKREGYL